MSLVQKNHHGADTCVFEPLYGVAEELDAAQERSRVVQLDDAVFLGVNLLVVPN